MQIDELPAGEQTQNPDLDMNQVVGTHDILMLCFDTLRYDVSKEEEEAGRTPVLNSHGGEWEKRHAPGNFTYPSHFAIFAGFLPSPAEPHSLRSRKWLFFPVQAGTGRIPPAGSYPHGNEIDVPLIYADYYFLEALKRKRDCDIEAKSKSVQK